MIFYKDVKDYGPASRNDGYQTKCRNRDHIEGVPDVQDIFLDNLKMFLAVLVVQFHSAQPYGPGGSWCVALGPNQTPIYFIVLGFFMAVNMSFFMRLLFMISTYFVPGSLDRKGPSKFMNDILVKLGVTMPIFVFGIFPAMVYLLYLYDQPAIKFYLSCINTFSPQCKLELAHLWFLALLLIFSAMYASYWLIKRPSSKAKRAFPGNITILAFVIQRRMDRCNS